MEVIFVPFANGVPSGPPQDMLSGFLDKDGHAQGRPVGVAIDSVASCCRTMWARHLARGAGPLSPIPHSVWRNERKREGDA